jgi:hypothetical protein
MGIIANALRVGIVAIIVVAVAELSKHHPRAGALLLSLPIVSILAILMGWFQHHDLPSISKVARETLLLVPLGLPFFVPLALASRMGHGFWPSLVAGIVLATLTTGGWLLLGPRG